ncbi:hypothetical protein [Sphingosinicella sp.]|uniref:hypothetical protein n=1 Tax=Sphingosinicella sp. TaxID=1917971 RepID=UPI0035B423CF
MRAFLGEDSLRIDEINDLSLSTFLSVQLKNIRRSPSFRSGPNGPAKARRASRNARTKFLNKLFLSKKRKRRVLNNIPALLYKLKDHKVRDCLYPNFQTDWIPIQRRFKKKISKEIFLTDFSFARNPHGTLTKLSELAEACCSSLDLRLHFLDKKCDDVAPYMALAHLTRGLPPIIAGGKITHEIGAVVTAVNMCQELGIYSIEKYQDSEEYSISAFKMAHRAPPGTFGDKDHLLRPQYKEIVADRFCDTLNGWIKSHGLELTVRAESSFCRAIGEALDNAERHGDITKQGSEGDWSISAFCRLLKNNEGSPLLRCSVGIVSVGATISQSLSTAAPEVRKQIDEYVQKHTPIFGGRYSSESLRTVMALQDGITRIESATQGRRGGVGFMELIEVFSALGDNGRPEDTSVFTIVSGNTCIRICDPYKRGMPKDGGLRELWFNANNDRGQAPSQEHVISLKDAFPGVILSACFTIDPEYLRKKLEK